MAETERQDFELAQKQNQSYTWELVMQSISQAKEGKTLDFNEVCERLQKKYTSAQIWDMEYMRQELEERVEELRQ